LERSDDEQAVKMNCRWARPNGGTTSKRKAVISRNRNGADRAGYYCQPLVANSRSFRGKLR
jgi:hypothetical protein